MNDNGMVRRLDGGFEAGGIRYPQCIVTKEPCVGAFAGGFTASWMQKGIPQILPFPDASCRAGSIVQAVKMLGRHVHRMKEHPPEDTPVMVDFKWFYLPEPGENGARPPPQVPR